MTGKGIWKARALMLLLVLVLAAQACGMMAAADDAELLAMLPGQWTCDDGVELTDQEMVDTNLVLTLGENGQMTLHCTMNEGKYDYTYEGTWTSELVTEMDPETGMTDKLTLRFTSTNNPLYDGSDYGVECVYHLYAEGWVENDTDITAMILEMPSSSGTTPFEDIYGWNGVTLYRKQGPNMRVANCKEYVSLREKRSASSKRLAKVPLGALVLAYPGAGDENGFIACTYHGQEGFILAEYLEPAE